MDTKKIRENRKNGIYYTPSSLAEHLVDPLIHSINQTIFDPAYGDGALLTAAEKALQRLNKGRIPRSLFYGCDIQPSNGKLTHFPDSNLSEQDFFDYSLANKYDVIIMNPPFVRHHLIDKKKREKYYRLISPICDIAYTSDLWVYFLIKAVAHLKKMGSIGAILPWSLLQADYTQRIRTWLLDKFEEIKILAVGSEYFTDTQERVLLVWLKNYGSKTRAIKTSFSRKVVENIIYMDLSKELWQSSPVSFGTHYENESIIQEYINKYGFVRFGQIAKIRIGVVTGADDFFILSETEAKNKYFTNNRLIPILTTAKEFSGFALNGKKLLKRLILFSNNNFDYEVSYIREGVKNGYNQRAHSQRRNPWYIINIGDIPDAFFPYRVAKIPYLMLNDGAQCTNSIHRIYFENLTENQKKWAQVSLLAVPGQLALESYAKTYGRGLLKIEPGALKKAIVYISNDPGINPLYKTISQLISTGQKFAAMIMAARFLNENLNIERSLSDAAYSALQELQNLRLNK